VREIDCAACQAKVPRGESCSLGGQLFCSNCIKQFVFNRPSDAPSLGKIDRLVDPTICTQCKTDHGTIELQKVAGAPMCDICSSIYRNRPFPHWLNFFFAVFVCLSGLAFAYNWPYFMAYVELLRGNRALVKGDLDEAIALFDSAALRVPSIPELAVFPGVFRAKRLVAQDKCADALTLLQRIRPFAPSSLVGAIQQIEIDAEMGVAFAQKDYDKFLHMAQQVARLEPQAPLAVCSLASAYACKYCTTGDPAFYQEAVKYLQQAKTLAPPADRGFAEYENRIQYRLATRTILTRAEFNQQYPNGWKAR
jgi:tetratricopeptide (TPR) repeat protein